MTDVSALADIPLLKALGADKLEILVKNLRPLHIEAGEALVSEGLTTRGPLFIITAGRVQVSRKDDHGEARPLVDLPPPTVIGEMEFLADIESSATVTAIDTVEGYLLPRARFEALFTAGEPVAYHLAKAIGSIVSLRLSETNRLLSKALSGERLAKVQKAQLSSEALAGIDDELDALLA